MELMWRSPSGSCCPGLGQGGRPGDGGADRLGAGLAGPRRAHPVRVAERDGVGQLRRRGELVRVEELDHGQGFEAGVEEHRAADQAGAFALVGQRADRLLGLAQHLSEPDGLAVVVALDVGVEAFAELAVDPLDLAVLAAQFGHQVLQRLALVLAELVRELPAEHLPDRGPEAQLLLRVLEERGEGPERPALRALPEPFVRLQHLRHGGALAQGFLDDLVPELAHQLLDPVTHLLVVRGQARGEVQDVARRLHGFLVVEQAVELAGADLLDQLAAFADLLFQGFQPGALVRVGLVGELFDVAQQRAEPGAVEGGAFTGEAVQEGKDAGGGLGDLVHDLAGLVPPGQEVLAGPLVAEALAVGGAAQPGVLAAELLKESVDVGVELFQRQLRPGAGEGGLQHGDHPRRRAGQRPGRPLGEEFEVPEPGADGVGGGHSGTGHAVLQSLPGWGSGSGSKKNCQLQG